jgi:hypothetical protein
MIIYRTLSYRPVCTAVIIEFRKDMNLDNIPEEGEIHSDDDMRIEHSSATKTSHH